MDAQDRRIRNETYRQFVRLGRSPSVDEIGGSLGLAADDVVASWRRLHDAHALVLEQEAVELRMLFMCSFRPLDGGTTSSSPERR